MTVRSAVVRNMVEGHVTCITEKLFCVEETDPTSFERYRVTPRQEDMTSRAKISLH